MYSLLAVSHVVDFSYQAQVDPETCLLAVVSRLSEKLFEVPDAKHGDLRV